MWLRNSNAEKTLQEDRSLFQLLPMTGERGAPISTDGHFGTLMLERTGGGSLTGSSDKFDLRVIGGTQKTTSVCMYDELSHNIKFGKKTTHFNNIKMQMLTDHYQPLASK